MAETRVLPSTTQANIEENLRRILALIDDLDERVEALEATDTSGGDSSGGSGDS